MINFQTVCFHEECPSPIINIPSESKKCRMPGYRHNSLRPETGGVGSKREECLVRARPYPGDISIIRKPHAITRPGLPGGKKPIPGLPDYDRFLNRLLDAGYPESGAQSSISLHVDPEKNLDRK